MTSRLALAMVIAAALVPAVASAAPRAALGAGAHVLAAAPSDGPSCGGPKNPEGPQPPKEPPKT